MLVMMEDQEGIPMKGGSGRASVFDFFIAREVDSQPVHIVHVCHNASNNDSNPASSVQTHERAAVSSSFFWSTAHMNGSR